MRTLSRLRRWIETRARDGATSKMKPPHLHDTLEMGRQRWTAYDPETPLQWRRLEGTLEDLRRAERPPQPLRRRPLARPAFSFAAALVLLIVLGIFWLQSPTTLTYETTRGQHSTISLSDSSEVTLNHTSELIVHTWSRGKPRVVALEGEAFFHVRRNGSPFTVSTRVGTVQVLGTEFNVRIRENSLEVGVLSGRVAVTMRKDGRDSSVVLGKGEFVACGGGDFPGSPEPLQLAEFPAWMHGKLMFYRTDVSSVCKEFESQFDITVTIDNPRLRHETITGTIDGRNIDNALTALTALTGSKYRHEKSTYTLY